MSTAKSLILISVEDYLQGEQESEVRHEYVAGTVYAMTGGTNAHATITLNSVASLHGQLSGKPCSVFSSDTKIRLEVNGRTRFYYPDVSVTCEPNALSEAFQDKPVVIIEVLSASTRRTDEEEKREAYCTIPTLQCYILLEQDSVGAIVYERQGDKWTRLVYTNPDDTIVLPDIHAELPLKTAYDSVEF